MSKACWSLLVAVLAPVLATATSVVPMSVERLTAASQYVLTARVLESWSDWNAEHTMIFTFTRFQVGRKLKGAAPETIVVKQMGGRAHGYVVKVAGIRYWRAGEEAVLFLHASQANDRTLVITGLMQGDFRIRRRKAEDKDEVTVSNGIPAARVFHAEGAPAADGGRMTLSELESRVRQAVGR